MDDYTMMEAPPEIRQQGRGAWWRWPLTPVVFLVVLFAAPVIYKASAELVGAGLLGFIPGGKAAWDLMINVSSGAALGGLLIFSTGITAPKGRFVVALVAFATLLILTGMTTLVLLDRQNWGELAEALAPIPTAGIALYYARFGDTAFDDWKVR